MSGPTSNDAERGIAQRFMSQNWGHSVLHTVLTGLAKPTSEIEGGMHGSSLPKHVRKASAARRRPRRPRRPRMLARLDSSP